MSATATPTIYDPKILFKGLLTTTLTTTLVTAPSAEAGVRIDTIILTNITTTAATVTLDHSDTAGANPFKIMNAGLVAGDGYPVIIRGPIFLNTTDLFRGGAGTASAIHCLIFGQELKD